MKTVAVIMGGPSREHDMSMMSGMNVTHALASKYHVRPIVVTPTGTWLVGNKGVAMPPMEALRGVDVVFNATHGEWGEDGKLQAILAGFHVTHTGSKTVASALAMHKPRANAVLKKAGLNVPREKLFSKEDYNEARALREIHQLSAPPWLIKPASKTASSGVSVARTIADVPKAIAEAFAIDDTVIAQEYISGRELTCGVLEHFDGKPHFALPPVEIIPEKSTGHHTRVAKYGGEGAGTNFAPFHGAMLAQIRDVAVHAHTAIGCAQYSRTDMILKGQKLYVLEVNALPSLASMSPFVQSASAMGLRFEGLVEHLVETA